MIGIPALPISRRDHPIERVRGLVVVLAVVVVLMGGASAFAAPIGEFDWPLRPRPAVDRRFDKPEQDWLPGHRGVDFAGTAGQAVLSAGAGIVVFAGTVAGRPVVSVDHEGGLRTTYEPVDATVSVGERVGRGTVLGTLDAGHVGCSAAACLHWGLRRESGRRGRPEYLDPLGLLRLAPLRLLPLEDWESRNRSSAGR